jgi:hypothetical protein
MGKKKKDQRVVDRPKVITWFVIYCVFLSLTSIIPIVTGIALLRAEADTPATLDKQPLPPVAYLIIGVLGFLTSIVAPFLANRPWKWVYGLILICLAMPACCYLPITIPLLIFWVQPETREYFKQERAKPKKHKQG